MENKSSPAPEENQPDLGAIELPAPQGWRKQFIPRKGGAPRRTDVVFISPSGEELKSKRQLELYMKSHPGGPSTTEFYWGTDNSPRRSSRLNVNPQAAEALDSEPAKKKQRNSSSNQLGKRKKDDSDEDNTALRCSSRLNVNSQAAEASDSEPARKKQRKSSSKKLGVPKDDFDGDDDVTPRHSSRLNLKSQAAEASDNKPVKQQRKSSSKKVEKRKKDDPDGDDEMTEAKGVAGYATGSAKVAAEDADHNEGLIATDEAPSDKDNLNATQQNKGVCVVVEEADKDATLGTGQKSEDTVNTEQNTNDGQGVQEEAFPDKGTMKDSDQKIEDIPNVVPLDKLENQDTGDMTTDIKKETSETIPVQTSVTNETTHTEVGKVIDLKESIQLPLPSNPTSSDQKAETVEKTASGIEVADAEVENKEAEKGIDPKESTQLPVPSNPTSSGQKAKTVEKAASEVADAQVENKEAEKDLAEPHVENREAEKDLAEASAASSPKQEVGDFVQ